MKNRIKWSGKTGISFALMVIGLFVAITAMKWPFRSSLFPLSVGICVFFMALADVLLGLLGKGEGASKQGAVDARVSVEIDPKVAFNRTISIFSWIFGFFLIIIFFGFTIAVPLMVFLYLKVQSKESWGLTLILTGATFVFFYGLFVWLIETPFPEGLLIRRLATMIAG